MLLSGTQEHLETRFQIKLSDFGNNTLIVFIKVFRPLVNHLKRYLHY